MGNNSNFYIDTHNLRDVIILLCHNTKILDRSIKSFLSKIGRKWPSDALDDTCLVISTNQKIDFKFYVDSQELIISYGDRIIFKNDDWFSEPINEKIKLIILLTIEKLSTEYDRIVSLQLEQIMNLDEINALDTIKKTEITMKTLNELYSKHSMQQKLAKWLIYMSLICASFCTLGNPIMIVLFLFPIFYVKRLDEENMILKQIEESQQGEGDKQILAIERIIDNEYNK